MTKETKIGLLVGLAFIILFAIILSEKGSSERIQAPSALTLADAGGTTNGADLGVAEPLSDAGRLPVKSNSTGRSEPIPKKPERVAGNTSMSGRPIPAEGEPIEPLPPSVVERLNLPKVSGKAEAGAGPARREVASDDAAPLKPDSMSLSEALAAALDSPTPAASSPPIDDGVDLAARSRSSKAAGPDRRATKTAARPKTSMKIIAVHTVRRGESLGKVAARYYGRSTPARIDAIFNANRDKLTSIHSVRAGDKLRVPQLTATQQIAFEPVNHFAPQQIMAGRNTPRDATVRIPIPLDNAVVSRESRAKADASPITRSARAHRKAAEPTEFRWYKVRKRDTLSRIARRELGSERRFVEIYRLNRDLISNRNKIKPGMKIRLPLKKKGITVSTAALAARQDTE